MSTALADQLILSRWRADRMAFRREAILLEDGQPFGAVMDPWQQEDFAALDAGEYRHAYLERPRGHSKTGDVATEAVTELMLGRPGQQLYCAAADEDQARLLFEDVAGKFHRHPMLRGSAKVTQREILIPATGSRLRVLASDAPSAYGLRPDWIAIDELSEWRRRELWDSLWSATGKRPRARVIVISSAGWDRTSIAWEVRSIAEREADWYFSPRGQCASWIRPEWVEQQRRTLPAHVFARLHESRWVEAVGAFLTVDEVAAVFVPVLPTGHGLVGIGVDLGVARDRSVVAVVRRHPNSGWTIVERLATWIPTAGRKVELSEVQADVAAVAKHYRAPVVMDAWQAELMGEQLRKHGVRVEAVKQFTAEIRRDLFGTLLDLIRSGRLKSQPHEELRRELLGLEVQETASGWRVDHRPGRHDDHAIAVALAIYALEHTQRPFIPLGWDPGERIGTVGGLIDRLRTEAFRR